MNLVLSLFPGADLLGYAFEREGFCVVKGPDVLFGGDIREFHPPAGRFDGIIGGPPCQPFSSLVHLVRANGHEPKHSNLIPEYERVVSEAGPQWFLMEEVPAAPVPKVEGYAVHSFRLDNSTLDSGDGTGNEQIRKRVFSFGIQGTEHVDLRKWIDFALFVLPDRAPTVLADGRNAELKSLSGENRGWRKPTVLGVGYDRGQTESEKSRRHAVTTDPRTETSGERLRRPAVTSHAEEVPVAIGGSGKPKANGRKGSVLTGHGPVGRGDNYKGSISIGEALQLQGLPETWLDGTPFTMHGKRELVGNGVPVTMGRQLAKAIRSAMACGGSGREPEGR